jgi:predicted metalloprotease with PDZ domain
VKKQKELYPPLINHEVDAVLVDMNSLKDVVHNLQRKHNIRVSGILRKETFYGIVLRETAENLTQCFRKYIEKQEYVIFSKMAEHSGTQKVRRPRLRYLFQVVQTQTTTAYCETTVY